MTLTVAQVKIGLDLRMTMKCAYCSREAGSSCTVKIPNDPNFYCSDFCAHRADTEGARYPNNCLCNKIGLGGEADDLRL